MSDQLKELLYQYVQEYPAFRALPVGAPESLARQEQERLIGLEDKAKKLLEGHDPTRTIMNVALNQLDIIETLCCELKRARDMLKARGVEVTSIEDALKAVEG
ncbi:MAG: hypothetical protein KDC85_24515 [Saprospiraceae bacterium]|nr:hypothetical protein [Saprospiraceae bacterium]